MLEDWLSPIAPDCALEDPEFDSVLSISQFAQLTPLHARSQSSDPKPASKLAMSCATGIVKVTFSS